MNDQLKEKLLKLLQMSKRGVGGEKVNAEKMLQRLLDVNGLKMSDIDDENLERQRVLFGYKTKAERSLVMQILYSVVGDANFYKPRFGRGVFADLTPSEKAEAVVKHDVWMRAYREELGVFHSAFIMRNHIYPSKPSGKSEADLTPEQLEKYMKAQKMAKGMTKADVFAQIGSGS